ncbi:hypothetical protein LSTR_LSTR017347 [Laodelphax striatellus]|uniref:Uncharacterized protein n=1 Tax=Laodelphax striatellus TaxID=195883 RepID=A0A482XL74_LAOST|nr:hypothetical protein LSTR_LSTR002758 [Laodelphax striatellus]RZF46845.1 hypothetical protein LSTR_LSTR017347 [Laodelphax striatellus]
MRRMRIFCQLRSASLPVTRYDRQLDSAVKIEVKRKRRGKRRRGKESDEDCLAADAVTMETADRPVRDVSTIMKLDTGRDLPALR